MPRAIAGVVIEAIFSMLLAPILMMTQTASVLQIAFGQDSGWKAQRRDAEGVEFIDALRFHWRHALAGTVLALLCWEATPGLARLDGARRLGPHSLRTA